MTKNEAIELAIAHLKDDIEFTGGDKYLVETYEEHNTRLREAIAILEQLCKMASTIGELLSNLPDSIHPDNESWDWCWDDLNEAAQEEVKNARFGAVEFLDKIGDSNAK